MTETIGQYLKRHREEKELTLESVANETHIRLEYLRAIENDKKDILPSEIQGKGFLRLYADLLNLDGDWLLTFWDTLEISASIADKTEQPVEDSIILDSHPVDTISLEPPPAPSAPSVTEGFTKDEQSNPAASENADVIETAPEKQSPTSIELLQSISDTLKTQRKLLKLSLLDVESLTHIRHQNLAAIEENQFDALPSSVQGRGMLQSYAEFLNLDTDQILLRYAEALQQKRSEKQSSEIDAIAAKKTLLPDDKQAETKKNSPLRQLISPDVLIGSGLIIVIVIVAVLSVTKVINTNRQMNYASLEATETALVLSSATITPTKTLTPSVTANPTDIIVVDPQSTTSVDATIETTAVNTNARLQLHLIANQRSYLKVTADDEIVFEGRVAPGNAYQFFGDEYIEIICGNAAAISAVLKQDDTQTDLGTLGTVGQVLQIRYQPDQIITPTSSPTLPPTNTNTPVPSLTPEPTQ